MKSGKEQKIIAVNVRMQESLVRGLKKYIDKELPMSNVSSAIRQICYRYVVENGYVRKPRNAKQNGGRDNV